MSKSYTLTKSEERARRIWAFLLWFPNCFLLAFFALASLVVLGFYPAEQLSQTVIAIIGIVLVTILPLFLLYRSAYKKHRNFYLTIIIGITCIQIPFSLQALLLMMAQGGIANAFLAGGICAFSLVWLWFSIRLWRINKKIARQQAVDSAAELYANARGG